MRTLKQNGLFSTFGELRDRNHHFGFELRTSMFSASPEAPTAGDQVVIGGLAALFGELTLTVAATLLNLRLRPALIPTYVCETQEELTRASDYLKVVLQQLSIKVLPPDAHTEPWLVSGAVDTSSSYKFPDVVNWISTLSQLSKLDALVRTTVIEAPKQPNKKRKRDKDAGA
jgi:hypothetical protein